MLIGYFICLNVIWYLPNNYRVSDSSCHPPKKQSPRHGVKEKKQSPRTPPMSGGWQGESDTLYKLSLKRVQINWMVVKSVFKQSDMKNLGCARVLIHVGQCSYSLVNTYISTLQYGLESLHCRDL